MKPVATGAWLHTGSSSRPSITGGAPERRRASRLRRSRSAGSQPPDVGQGAAWTADTPRIHIAISRSGFMSGGPPPSLGGWGGGGEKVSASPHPYPSPVPSPPPSPGEGKRSRGQIQAVIGFS